LLVERVNVGLDGADIRLRTGGLTTLVADLQDFFTQGKLTLGFFSGDEPPGTTRVAWQEGEETLVMLFDDRRDAMTMSAQAPTGWKLARQDGRGDLRMEGTTLTARVGALDCRWAVLQR